MEFSGLSSPLRNSDRMIRATRNKMIGLIAACCAALLLYSCGNQGQPSFSDTSTSGEIWIGVDDSYKLLFDTEVDVFQSLYPNSRIHIISGSETQLMRLLNADSIRLAIMGRKLTDAEKESFTKRNSSVTD